VPKSTHESRHITALEPVLGSTNWKTLEKKTC